MLKDRKSIQSTALILLGVLGFAWVIYSANPQSGVRETSVLPEEVNDFQQPPSDKLYLIAQFVRQALRGEGRTDIGDIRLQYSDGIYVALRESGVERASTWTPLGSAAELLADGLHHAAAQLDPGTLALINAVEICLSHNSRNITAADLPSNIERGILGIRAIYNGAVYSFSPTEMIAKNLSFENALERIAATLEISTAELAANAQLQVFDCEQLLVFLDSGEPAIPLFRGNQTIPVESVTLESATEFAQLASEWMVRQVQEDGRMVYLYYPSRGEESTGNNQIRQWMATLALDRIAENCATLKFSAQANTSLIRHADTERSEGEASILNSLMDGLFAQAKGWHSDAILGSSEWQIPLSGNSMQTCHELPLLIRKNIDYNLEHFYFEENGLGLIDEFGTVKLGAVALAALALHESPAPEEFPKQIEALAAGVDHLWREDGSFETFYRPAERSGQNQNFYPGEALLFWSVLYAENRDAELLDRIMQSFRYYRVWHRENINPAFIPWHTQAYYNVWKLTGNEELKDFIFEMNDWLLDFQEIEAASYPDTPGRFYDTSRPQYGPPHASSDGVYLEGLVDAYLLAKEVGDSQRAANYARSIRYVLRSLMQLQFADEIDMFYISKTENVLGGLRTTHYDNAIRVDNVQHGLMGVLKILSNPEANIFE